MNQTTKPLGWCATVLVVAGISTMTPAHAQSTALDSTWTYASGSSGWIPDTVSIGDEGQRVFSAVGTFGSSARLFSESATPIATDAHTEMSYRHMVDSSENCGRRTWLHYRGASVTSPANPELRIYDTDNSSPAVTYTFPFTVSQPFGGTQISDEGDRVCAWVYNFAALETVVAVFEGSSTTPSVYTTINTFVEPKGAKLSKDGTRLYMVTGPKTFIMDTTTGDLIQTLYNFYSVGNAQALSPNGDMFAQGSNSNELNIYRQQGGSYSSWYSHQISGDYESGRACFSGDGRTLVATFDGTLNDRIRVIVLDLDQPVPVVKFDHELFGGGSLALATSDLEVDHEGRRAFVGTWGDELGLVPEVMVFGASSDGSWTQTHSVDLSGSVRDLDIDRDGLYLAVASKTVHATQVGGGGRYDLYELPDASGMRLIGTPTAGGTIEVRVSCPPDKTGLLLASDNLATTPMNFGGTGRLFLERSGLQFLSRTTENGSGELVFTLSLATASAGDTIHVQGLVFGPRRLSPGALTIEVTD